MQGDGGQGHIAQSVAEDNGRFGFSSGPGEEDVILLHDVGHFLPGVKGDVGYPGEAEGQRRENGVAHPVQKAHLIGGHPDGHRQSGGQQPQPHRKNHHQKKGQPEGRGAGDDEAIALYQLVRPLAPVGPRKDAQSQAQHPGEHPRRQHQPERTGQPLADDLGHRLTEIEGGPQIAVQNISQPAQIALQRGRSRPPVGLQTGNLLGAHAAHGRLTHIGLEGVQRRGVHQQKGRQTHPQKQQGHTKQLTQGKAQAVFHKSSLFLTSSTGPRC